MVDYCMCPGTGCKDRDSCYRFRAPAAKVFQSYYAKAPGTDKNCGHFMAAADWGIKSTTPP